MGENNLDSLLGPLGGFGKFQIVNLLCLSYVFILCGMSQNGYVMMAADLKHR